MIAWLKRWVFRRGRWTQQEIDEIYRRAKERYDRMDPFID